MPYLLELLDRTLVDTTALVDQVCMLCELLRVRTRPRRGRLTSSGRRLAGVDVADNDDVDMDLLLTADVVSDVF